MAAKKLLEKTIWLLRDMVINRGVSQYSYLGRNWPADNLYQGWNCPQVANLYEKKWNKFLELACSVGPLGFTHEADLKSRQDIYAHNIVMTFAYVIAKTRGTFKRISILDWGGGPGHYSIYAKALFPDLIIDYHCKDVPIMVELGKKLLPGVVFYDDQRCFERSYDLVMASVSLQYSKDWFQTVKKLASVAKSYLYIAQIPTIEQNESFVFLQRPYCFGYNTQYPAWCLNKAVFLESVIKEGFRLEREFIYGYQPYIHMAPEQNEYKGFLFSRV